MRIQPSNSNSETMVSQETNSPKEMSGKVVLITGASSGIGLATACELARRGAHVILLCRDKTRGEAALAKVNEAGGNAEAELLLVDLASFASIRAGAKQFLATHSKLDVLINNAGLPLKDRRVTVDGYEEVFAVNHLSHFLLTHLLLPVLKASAPARIINVSSLAHAMGGKMHWDDLMLEKSYKRWPAYSQSKLANILFTIELAKRLKGEGITVNTLHPGLVDTRFTRGHHPIFQKLFRMVAISAEQGAQTSVYLATSKDVENVTGLYFVKMKPHKTSARARNEADAARLWKMSEKLTGIASESVAKEAQKEAGMESEKALLKAA